jgi:Zn-dependent protease
LHWSWFILAFYEMSDPLHRYSSVVWNIWELVGVFMIVTLHEFGHALACRQVGGQADQIVLWPLGGVAYVDPPQRPGATLWSIAAGPLVNVLLLPVFSGIWFGSHIFGWEGSLPNLYSLIVWIWRTNLAILCFNLLPVYPLDGGQILRSLLWFLFGRARSLMIAAVFGFAVAGLAIALLLIAGLSDFWILILGAFVLLNCWRGFQQARDLSRLERAPRRADFKCPGCQASPPAGAIWLCGKCRKPFDAFETDAMCPHCGAQFAATRCLECGGMFPIGEWGGTVTTSS